MDILKNVSSSLWNNISWNKNNTIIVRRDLLLQILRRDIGQEMKLEERLVSLGLLKKVMSHGF
jgi:hypothetical protein